MPFIRRTSGLRYLREVLRSKKHLAGITLRYVNRRFSGTGGYQLAGEIKRFQNLIEQQELGHPYVFSDDALGITCSCGLILDHATASTGFFSHRGHLDMQTKRLTSFFTISSGHLTVALGHPQYFCQLCKQSTRATESVDPNAVARDFARAIAIHRCHGS